MKIGYILTTFPCRTETFAAREIQALRKLGFDVTVLAAQGQNLTGWHSQNVQTIYRPRLFSVSAVLSVAYMAVKYPLAFSRLLCLILKAASCCPREAILLLANLHTICFFARCLDAQSISHIHAYFLSWPACIALAVATITNRTFSIAAHARDIFVEAGAAELKISRAKFITACTLQGLNHLKTILPAKYYHKLHLIHHGIQTASIHTDRCSKDVSGNEPKSYAIAVGRLIPKKGFANLLRAFALLAQETPNCRLIIVGDGPRRKQLSKLTRQLHLEDSVQLLGWQQHNVTLRLIAQAVMLIVPSVVADDGDRDGLPNVILEAFAHGTPVIATSLPGIREAVINEQTGLLVIPDDAAELASAIKKLLSDKAMRARLSQNAHQLLASRFDLEKNVRQLSRVFENALTQNKKIRVAHIVEGFVGGMATYMRTVLLQLAQNGFDVTLICSLNRCRPDAHAWLSKLREAGLTIHTINMYRNINPFEDIRSFVIILRLLLKNKFEI